MNYLDAINGTFAFIGGLFLIYNCYKLYKDQQVRGVSLLASGFFAIWSWWNLYYFNQLDQPCSFIASGWIAVPNTIWISMAVWYKYIRKALII